MDTNKKPSPKPNPKSAALRRQADFMRAMDAKGIRVTGNLNNLIGVPKK